MNVWRWLLCAQCSSGEKRTELLLIQRFTLNYYITCLGVDWCCLNCMCCTHFKSTITPHKLNYFCIFTVAFFISNFTDIQIENLCTFSLDLIQWFEFTAKWTSIYCLSMIMSMGMAIGTYISYCYMPPNQNINKMIEPGCAHDVHFESLKYISFFFRL